jgi:hypothetical protein
MEKHNGDNIGSFHTLYLCKTKDLSNNDFDAQKFENIYFTEQTGKYGKAIKNSNNGSFWEHSLTFEVPKYRPDVEAWLLLHIDVPLIAYIHSINGEMIRIGTKVMPLFLSVDLDLGKKFADFNSYTFKGKADELLKRNFGVTLVIPPPPPPPPDEEDGLSLLQNADLILSTRRIKDDYTGYAFLLRKNDGVTQYRYFPFLPNGELDMAALETWSEYGDLSLFVAIWFDQSGNARHFSQDDYNQQPQIYNQGGVPKVLFADVSASIANSLNCSTSTHTSEEPRTIFSKIDGAGDILTYGNQVPSLIFRSRNKGDVCFVFADLESNYKNVAADNVLANNLFTYTYRGIGNYLDFYVNKDKYITQEPMSPTTISVVANNMILGNNTSEVPPENLIPFVGTMQTIIVINGELTSTQIDQIQDYII